MSTVIIKNTYIDSNCYTNNKTLNSIDLHSVPFVNNNMYKAFEGCIALTSIANLNENVIDMWHAFNGCQQLTAMPNIPATTTNLASGFSDCHSLTTFTEVPTNVTNISGTFTRCYSMTIPPSLNCQATDMTGCFSECNNLEITPAIPGTVTDMTIAFSYCEKLTVPPNMPLSVTDMYGTFANCTNLSTMPTLPESTINIPYCFEHTNISSVEYLPRIITNMYYTFGACNNLQFVNAIIPPSVEKMGAFTSWTNAGTFESCQNLTGNIYIASENIQQAYSCFNNTSLSKNVYIPFKQLYATDIYGEPVDVYSRTYNAFTNAGYTTDGSVNGVYLKNIQETHNLTLTATPADANITYNIQSCIPMQSDQEYMYAWEYNGGSDSHYKQVVLINSFLPADGNWRDAFTTLSSGTAIPQKLSTTDIKFQVLYQHGASITTYHYNYTRNPQKDGYYTTIPSGQTYSCSAPVHSIIRYTAFATGYQSTPGEVAIEDTDVAQTVILEPNP